MILFEDRMALVRAGYTASQIAEFETAKDPQHVPNPEPVPQPVTQPEPVPQPVTQPEPVSQPIPQPSDFAAMMQSINNSMAAIVSAMQAKNIKTADMREHVEESPGDILAKLLNP